MHSDILHSKQITDKVDILNKGVSVKAGGSHLVTFGKHSVPDNVVYN